MADDHAEFDRIDRRRLLQGLGGASLVALAGCAGGDGEATESPQGGAGQSPTATGDGSSTQGGAQEGGTLRLAQVKSPIEFDPIVLNDVPSAEVAGNVFEGLYEFDDDINLVPQLADGEPEVSDDATTWTVTLREGPTFHNGDPVTPEDVKYSFEAPVAEETENAAELNMIDTVEVDGQQVIFNLQYPYGAFRYNLAWSIVPQSVREDDPQAFNVENPVGSGAFTFEDWQEGDFVRLSRWDDYWGEESPNLESVEFVPIEEGTTRVTTLRNGENDVIKEIPPQLWTTVEQQIGNASIDAVPGIGYFYLSFNCREGPTTDPQVREAVDYCFDMDQAVSNFVEPTGVRQYSPLPEAVAQEWDMPIDQWQQIPHGKDIQQAQQLFDEVGVPNDYPWRIIVPPDDKREQLGITVGNGLREAGFQNVSVQRLDWGAFLDQYVSGSEDDYNLYALGWAGVPDPDSFTYFLFARTDDVLGVTNGTFYGDNSQRGEEAVQKFVQARESTEQQERRQLYEEAITTVLEDRAHLPSYNLKNSFGVRDHVQDFAAIPTSEAFHLFSNHNNVSINQQ